MFKMLEKPTTVFITHQKSLALTRKLFHQDHQIRSPAASAPRPFSSTTSSPSSSTRAPTSWGCRFQLNCPFYSNSSTSWFELLWFVFHFLNDKNAQGSFCENFVAVILTLLSNFCLCQKVSHQITITITINAQEQNRGAGRRNQLLGIASQSVGTSGDHLCVLTMVAIMMTSLQPAGQSLPIIGSMRWPFPCRQWWWSWWW